VDVLSGVGLFLSVRVCLFVRTITSERLNVGPSNLAVRYNVQKSRKSSTVKVSGQRSKVKVTGDKKRNTAESSPLTMHSRASAVARPYAARSTQHAATNDTNACRPGVTGYASGKISTCCLVYTFWLPQ